jgi:hypothetical protein
MVQMRAGRQIGRDSRLRVQRLPRGAELAELMVKSWMPIHSVIRHKSVEYVHAGTVMMFLCYPRMLTFLAGERIVKYLAGSLDSTGSQTMKRYTSI